MQRSTLNNSGQVRASALRRVAGVLACFGLSSGPLCAADVFPTKAIRMVVPFPPGGGTDIVARIVARPMAAEMGQSVVVDNRPGASGITGTDLVAKAAPDGHTLGTVIITHATNPALHAKLPFDAITDFTPVGLLTKNAQLLVVNASMPVKSVAELIAVARASKEELIFASGGNGTPSHLAGELLKSTAKINLLHIAYKGSAPAILDLLSDRVAINFSSLPALLAFVKSGRLTALSITGLTRSPLLPQVPTIAESGFPGFEVSAWQGLLAPAATPRKTVALLNAGARAALGAQDVSERLIAQGYEPAAGTPEEFGAYLRSETEKWGRVIKANRIRAE